MGTWESNISPGRVPGRWWGQTCFSCSEQKQSQWQENEGKGRRKPTLQIICKRVIFKYHFSGHVEVLLAVYCELDQDIPGSRDKVVKTDPLDESRSINYLYQHPEDTINNQRDVQPDQTTRSSHSGLWVKLWACTLSHREQFTQVCVFSAAKKEPSQRRGENLT